MICSYVSDAISVRVNGPAEADCTPVASASAAARPAAFQPSAFSVSAMTAEPRALTTGREAPSEYAAVFDEKRSAAEIMALGV